MSTRGISLTRHEQERVFLKNRGDAFRLKIVAHDAVMMPKEIFAHQRRLIDPHTGLQGDEFCFITSPFDATIYPANEPDPLQFPQYFRKDTIDILVPSQEAAADTWDEIYEQVCRLVTAYNNLDVLVEIETVRCGADVEESVSAGGDSVSESASLSESV